ncbi:MAG TPA: tRNA (adenosine(37)-N6)-dimethylallyltransferase MiaA [Desulfuromonadaceae bacterium]|nr:tRNA (adenosine(37)-N6)-dimethylallyltransferase MiaA [Desulfuromonadaceae bacterium]
MDNDIQTYPPSSILHPRCLFIAGPTAVGKSEVALSLAEKIGGEIVSVDSMQVYRGLDLGTAKPSAAERARVPHHLIDVCDLAESFDAARFIRLAQAAVAEIGSRSRVPIFCGGTGLYFKAYLSGLGEAPSADPALRAQLEAMPYETLLQELRERDPAAYEKIDKQNPRRVIRAVEVIRLTGKKFSEQKAEWKTEQKAESGNSDKSRAGRKAENIFGLTRKAEDLHARINGRVDEMFRRGLVEEVRELLEHGLDRNQTAMQAIGYRQVVEHLRGERDLKETVELVKIKTRQFAKRQLTWFRRYGDCEWIELSGKEFAEVAMQKIQTRLAANP